jgi:hypothetical protein
VVQTQFGELPACNNPHRPPLSQQGIHVVLDLFHDEFFQAAAVLLALPECGPVSLLQRGDAWQGLRLRQAQQSLHRISPLRSLSFGHTSAPPNSDRSIDTVLDP